MTYPTPDQFKSLLQQTESLTQVNKQYVFEGEAFCFRKQPQDYQVMRELLAEGIGLNPEDFTIVGSGKIGFSLDPKNPFTPYTVDKDIDVVVTSAPLFDRFWSNLIMWGYPLLGQMPTLDRNWFSTHKNDVFWGYVSPGLKLPRHPAQPELIRPIYDFYNKWQSAFLGLGRRRAFTRMSISGRLYRSWEHAEAYHVDGLRLIRSSISTKRGDQ